jgi:hypothetical protein
VDVTFSDAQVTLRAHLTDDLSGATEFSGVFLSPSGRRWAPFTGRLTSGTGLDGIFEGTAQFLQYTEPGVWQLSKCWDNNNREFPCVGVVDRVGNGATVDLATSGVPLKIGVLSVPAEIAFSLEPSSAESQVGSPHTLTATILQNNQPLAGTQVRFDIISGPHDGTSGSITTDYSGKSTFSYIGTAAGIDTIIASIDTDGDGEYDAARQATVEWKKSSTVNVKMDIKPLSKQNSINCQNQNGVITVAILTTDDFDATTVDHTTVLFEGAEETHIDKQTGLPRRHEEDVDNDG